MKPHRHQSRTLDLVSKGALQMARWAPLRRALFGGLEAAWRRKVNEANGDLRHPIGVERDRLAMKLAAMNAIERALANDRLSKATLDGFLGGLMGDVLVRRGDQDAKARFSERRGCNPPDFMVISPGKACNLRCEGCYANSGENPERLSWDTFDRIVREAHDIWGTRFFVISGGEPLAYKDQGRTVMDLAERHPDCFFMMYTNGVLIDEARAERIAELGNLSPALSVEGLRERTDARRGDGTFDKVLDAIGRLQKHKILFGMSLTATRANAEEVLGDEVVDLFFHQLGAAYAWIFHYMPIGRSFTLDLMITPEQRVKLFRRVWELVKQQRLFLADFWASATATNGCLAGGRSGGYFYIDWNGAISPCVFMPYAPLNINEVYAQGKTLDSVWDDAFFASIRKWQREYGYRENGEAYEGGGNWIRPCLIRDHHATCRQLIDAHQPVPANPEAREALTDPAYTEGLEQFDGQLANLTDPVWEGEYKKCPETAPEARAKLPTPCEATCEGD